MKVIVVTAGYDWEGDSIMKIYANTEKGRVKAANYANSLVESRRNKFDRVEVTSMTVHE